MSVIIIVAMDENRVIGANNDLLWKIRKDMEFFKVTTKGNAVVFRKLTWESIPEKFRPLKDRLNVVITRQGDYQVPQEVLLAKTELEAIHKINQNQEYQHKDIYLCGGESSYKEGMNLADKILVTQIHTTIDTSGFKNVKHFPEIDLNTWKLQSNSEKILDEKSGFEMTFQTYVRKDQFG